MTLVKWDPLCDAEKLQNRINRMFEDSFGHTRNPDDEMSQCAWRPLVDIYETDNGIALMAELPGVGKENISVEVKDNILTLRGERAANQNIPKKKSTVRSAVSEHFKDLSPSSKTFSPV